MHCRHSQKTLSTSHSGRLCTLPTTLKSEGIIRVEWCVFQDDLTEKTWSLDSAWPSVWGKVFQLRVLHRWRLHTHRIHEVSIDFCSCRKSDQHHTVQLLCTNLFSAMIKQPKTAATTRVLELFELLSYKSKASAFEFYNTLSWFTDNTGISPPKVTSKAFWANKSKFRTVISPFYIWHMNGDIWRCSSTQEEDTIPRELYQWSQENVLCYVPHVRSQARTWCWDGKMSRQDIGWSLLMGISSQISTLSLTKIPRYFHMLFVSFDANFQMRHKNVSSDKVDPSLSKGWSYFIKESGYKAHIQRHANDTVPVCQTLK